MRLLISAGPRYHRRKLAGAKMTTVSIALPGGLKAWIDSQVKTGRFEDAGDCIRDLIRRDQKPDFDFAALQDAVDSGMASGFREVSPQEVLRSVKARHAVKVKLRLSRRAEADLDRLYASGFARFGE
jgi:antitoxin ParD1/3/4